MFSLVFFTFGLWALSFPLGKFSLLTGAPCAVVGLRLLLTTALLFAWMAWRKPKILPLKKACLFPAILMGLSGFYLTNLFELKGLALISSTKASLIFSLAPLFAALISYFQLKEKVTIKKATGLLIGFLGSLPLFMEGSSLSIFSISIGAGELAIMAATALAMYGWVLIRRLVNEQGMHPLAANAWTMFFGAIFCGGHLLWQGLVSEQALVYDVKPFILSTIALTIISNLVCNGLYSYLLKRYTVTFLALAGMSSPLFAALWGWLLFQEPFVWYHLLAGIVMAAGLALVYAEDLKLGYLNQKSS